MLLSYRNLTISFGGPKLLDDAGLTIAKRERICLLGRNGEGKSTLLRILNGEIQPDTGEIEASQASELASSTKRFRIPSKAPFSKSSPKASARPRRPLLNIITCFTKSVSILKTKVSANNSTNYSISSTRLVVGISKIKSKTYFSASSSTATKSSPHSLAETNVASSLPELSSPSHTFYCSTNQPITSISQVFAGSKSSFVKPTSHYFLSRTTAPSSNASPTKHSTSTEANSPAGSATTAPI